jgi:hypothetical protein
VLTIDKPAQTHAEIVAALRLKIVELQGLGVLSEDGAQLYQGQMLQLLATIEEQRDKCENQANQWLQKYHYALGRREAFTMLRSLLDQLMNASISRAKSAIELEQELAEIESTRIIAPDPVEPTVTEPTTKERPAGVAPPQVEGVLPEHMCICGRTFNSVRARAGHRGRCVVFKEAMKAANGKANGKAE